MRPSLETFSGEIKRHHQCFQVVLYPYRNYPLRVNCSAETRPGARGSHCVIVALPLSSPSGVEERGFISAMVRTVCPYSLISTT